MSIFGCQNTYTTVWIMKIRSKFLTKQKQKQKTKQTKTKHQQQQKNKPKM